MIANRARTGRPASIRRASGLLEQNVEPERRFWSSKMVRLTRRHQVDMVVLSKGNPWRTENDLLSSATFCENTMPTVLRLGPYRFFFYAGDGEEPLHVHVERDDSEAFTGSNWTRTSAWRI
jgi:hypothetical protein